MLSTTRSSSLPQTAVHLSLGLVTGLTACGDGASLDPAAGRWAWTQALGGPGADEVMAIAVDETGVIVTGTFEARLEAGGRAVQSDERRDLFWLQLDRDGAVVDLRAVPQGAGDIAVLRANGRPSEGAWLGGTFFGDRLPWPGAIIEGLGAADGFALRAGFDGTAGPVAVFAGPGLDVVSGIAARSDGGAWVAGRFEASLTGPPHASTAIPWTATSRGAADVFIARLTGDARIAVARIFGGPGVESTTALTGTHTGGAVIAAVYDDALPWGPTLLDAPAAGRASVVSGLAQDGDVRWVTRLGDGVEVLDVVSVPSGETVVASILRAPVTLGGITLDVVESTDILVVRLDSEGRIITARRFGGPDIDLVRAAAVDRAGGIWLTGTFRGPLTFGETTLDAGTDRDLYVARLGPDLTPQWATAIGGPSGDQVAAAIAIAPDGAAIVAAGFQEAIDAGDERRASRGGFDVLIGKLRP